MLSSPLSTILRTTTHHLRRLKELGIETVSDFLMYFPYRYTDQREIYAIKDIRIGELNTIRASIQSINSTATFRKRMAIVTALLTDETGSIEAVWFRQGYIARSFGTGMRVVVAGKIKYDAKKGRIFFQNPIIEAEKKEQVHSGRIVPVYHETEIISGKAPRLHRALTSKWIREKLFPLIKFTDEMQEFLPDGIRKTYKFTSYADAVRSVHFPKNEKDLERGKKRLAFDELFLLQCAAMHRRQQYRKIAEKSQKAIAPNWDLIKKFTLSLPWPLTKAQKKAIYEIINDCAKPYPMSRLLEGDVGSGKTVVATAAVLHTIYAGFQTCFVAPTEILARQHFETLNQLLKPFSITPAFISGATPEKEKQAIREGLQKGSIKAVVGTHALLQENIHFEKLSLAIIDEQHRFGVRQREILRQQGSPHMLHLTATPIPRTLALIVYGDQDLSVLDEMPKGRKPVETHVVPEEKRIAAYKWIAAEIRKGRQAFIVFPLIYESEILEVKAATQEYERLSRDIFPEFRLGLLHGQLNSAEKEKIMKQFRTGELQILISTAVVEVGVDVPNATIMMIEGAERFGLAQLHQFRGRVGRGSEKSYCFLFPSQQTPETIKRLYSLVKHNSGFRLAEIDLQMRGPGEVYGTSQSGIPDLKMASLSDAITIKQARQCAEMIIKEDPEFKKYSELKKKIAEQENIAIDY